MNNNLQVVVFMAPTSLKGNGNLTVDFSIDLCYTIAKEEKIYSVEN